MSGVSEHHYARWFAETLRHLGDEQPALHGILAPLATSGTPRGVTAQFLENAADYHARYANVGHFRVLLDDALATLDPPLTPRTILDIGSGAGNSVLPLLDRYPDAFIVATDVSAPLLAILRDELAAHPRYAGRFALVNVDAAHARYRAGAFDLAVGAAILHHVMDPAAVVDACHEALRPGGAAIFFEPFELGHAVLHIAYAAIVVEAEQRGNASPGIEMLRRLAADYAARTGARDRAGLEALDDKWMFTRSFFEDALRRGRWAECRVYPIHGSEAPLTEETRVNLKLGMGVEPAALPQWAWERLAQCERAFSPAARHELMFEGAVVLRTSAATPARATRAGWWFNAAEPGQGFFVEIDGDSARVVCCVYGDDGEPVWHAGGPAPLRDDTLATPTRAGVFPGDVATDPAPSRALTLRFLAPDRASLLWDERERPLTLQHAHSPGWNGASAGALGGCWIEDDDAPALAALVEHLDHRVFVALLSRREWCVASATRRSADCYAGQWLRFRGGQTMAGPYRSPGEPARLGEARLLWTSTGRLLVGLPGGRQRVLRKA